MPGLEERWNALCRRLYAERHAAHVYALLTCRYGEPHRAYHNLDHVAQCLREFDSVRRLTRRPVAVELAIWFHDVVYDPRGSDNEEKSAALAARTLRRMGLQGDLPHQVSALVRLTRHDTAPKNIDGRFLIDIDLSILGQRRGTYDDYEARVRKEYSWASDNRFWSGRGEILRAFLARKRIFSTAAFFRKYECVARSNLRRSLRKVAGSRGKKK